MKTYIFTIIAILLAIPTYGISIVVWYLAKYKYDKFCATRVLINAVVISYENSGREEIRQGINNAALPLLFDCFGGEVLVDLTTTVSGVLMHPNIDVMLVVTLTQISNNRLLISATPV